MGIMQAVVTDELAALAADYPAWHIWRGRSSSGAEVGWHATRHPRPGRPALPPGLLPALAAGSAGSLHAQLEQQEVMEKELAA